MPNFDREFLAAYLRPHWPRLSLLAVLLFSSIGLQLANPQLARLFIDRAQAGASFDTLAGVAAAFLVVALLTQIAMVAETFVAEDLGWRTTNELRVDVTRHVLTLDDSFHAEHGAGELLERIDGDVSAIAAFFARFVVHVAGSALFLLGVLALLWREDWRVGGTLTLLAVGAAAFMTRGGAFVGERSRLARQANADLSAYLEERLAGLADIKANGADDYSMRGLHQRLAARFHTGRRSVMAASMFSNTVNACFVAGTAATLVTSAVLHRSGALTTGAVFMVFRYTAMLRIPLERLSRHMNSFQQATGGIVRVKELLDTKPRVTDGAGATIEPGPLAVAFDDVSFSYGDEPVLQNVTWNLEPGRVLGLLGRTGSGKTTVSRLLFRLHDVGAGAIRVGNVDIRSAKLEELRRHIGLVTQDVQLFAGTLRDNVTLFDEAVSERQLLDVFAGLGLKRWIESLPDGLDTVLGAGGRGVSAGEAQLVALARVFLEDPGVVVLDEASSRLDPHTERLVEHAVTRLLDGRTGIVIAHRLSTVQRADLILVLESGQVGEFGPRPQLAADPDSRFARLLRTGLPEVLA